jgi:hypothetical protein
MGVISKSASLGVGRTVVEVAMDCTCGAVQVSSRASARFPLDVAGRWEVRRVRPVSVTVPFTGLSGARAAPVRHIPRVRYGVIHSYVPGVPSCLGEV